MNKKIIIPLIALIVVLAGGILTWQYFGTSEEEVRTLEEIAKDETVNWQTYRNEKYKFEIKYPLFYEECSKNENNLFCIKKQDKEDGLWSTEIQFLSLLDTADYQKLREDIINKVQSREDDPFVGISFFDEFKIHDSAPVIKECVSDMGFACDVHVYFKGKNNILTIRSIVFGTGYDDYRKELQKILSTLKFID